MVIEQDMVVGEKMQHEADQENKHSIFVQQGDTCILPPAQTDPKQMIEMLAGSLGKEAAEEYDFLLKIGGLYEAR